MSDWDPAELRTLRDFFLDEAAEHLEAAVRDLSQLGRDDDAELITSLLRRLHTIKGSAGSVELPEVAQAAHAAEDQLLALRADPGALPAVNASLTGLQRLIDATRTGLRPQSPPTLASAPPPRRDRRAVERPLAGPEQTVRVEVERIDEIMDAASELVFDRTRIARRLQDLERRARALDDGELVRLCVGLGEDLEGLRRTSSTLQDRIRRVRRVEIGRLFSRLQQPLQELAKREGKEVALAISGDEAELDKAIADRIAEPLLHLLRNAVAHGIEPPAVRAALGKPTAGTVSLTARQADDAIEIVVRDDGQGVDTVGVRRALVAAGRFAPAEAEALDDEALFAALFEPGLSTRSRADDVAGRGVGLDVVRDALARLQGTVWVTSVPGQGAAFTVRLPLFTAVQEALLFKVGGQVYAVPAARVVETLEVTPVDVYLGEVERLVVGRRLVPLVRLGALFGVPPPPGQPPKRAALVLSADDANFAVTCDRVIGPREIVVRSLGPLLAHLPLYSGATISGAGKVQLLLDVSYLAELAHVGVQVRRPPALAGPRRVLVADDSRAIREAAALILSQGGWTAETVADGWDGWELLHDRPFDVLVTDLEMPRLDGYELLERVRRAPELRGLPVVVVSSRAEAARPRVLAAGADAVVDKPLRRRALLEAIELAISARARAPRGQ